VNQDTTYNSYTCTIGMLHVVLVDKAEFTTHCVTNWHFCTVGIGKVWYQWKFYCLVYPKQITSHSGIANVFNGVT